MAVELLNGYKGVGDWWEDSPFPNNNIVDAPAWCRVILESYTPLPKDPKQKEHWIDFTGSLDQRPYEGFSYGVIVWIYSPTMVDGTCPKIVDGELIRIMRMNLDFISL